MVDANYSKRFRSVHAYKTASDGNYKTRNKSVKQCKEIKDEY